MDPQSLTDTIAETGLVPLPRPAVPHGSVAGVPLTGTGLTGLAYAPGDRIGSIRRLDEIIAATEPQAAVTVREIGFAARDSDTTLAAFLGDRGTVTSGDGGIEMGPSGLVLTGFVYIPPGRHEIAVTSDDGFALGLGGVPFMASEGRRGVEETARTAEFEGGLYAMELRYFDAGGRMALNMEIDGLPVDQSAFYAEADDFTAPPEDMALVPEGDYHPSYSLGALVLDDAQEIETGDGSQTIDALGGDDTVRAGAGDDVVQGGYGDDSLEGGEGDDVLDGGYGSDLLIGGPGRDLLVSRSDGGEQKIAQRSVIPETRPDGGQVNPAFDKLHGYEHQPLIGDDILVGGPDADTFLIAPQINATLPIIEEHVRSDGSIRWAGVAGENTYQHDHWVDLFGFDLIADYDAELDHIAVIGHTANVSVEHVDFDRDGVTESIVTVISKQHGNGGAHDRDFLGALLVEGDLVTPDDIQTDAGVTWGVVESYHDVAEAIAQTGETKTVTERGVTHHGYDYRGPGEVERTPDGAPKDLMDTPWWDDAQAHITGPTPPDGITLTRAPFAPLAFEDAPGQVVTGSSFGDRLVPEAPAAPPGLPGALGVWALGEGPDGATRDGRGEGPAAKAYTLWQNQALPRTDASVEGPRPGTPALSFDGEDDFAYLPHDPAFEVTQGTIALWLRADDLSDDGAIVTKDQRKSGEGGHFRLVQLEDGKLLLRFAPGDGGANRAWTTMVPVLEEGVWAHLAVSFTEDGVTVRKDGMAIPDELWTPDEGDVASPGVYAEAYLLQNAEPWIFGADQRRTELNGTAQAFATDDGRLDAPFTGAIAEFAVWGGYSKEDALTGAEIAELMATGPGTALTNPSGPQPMAGSDDAIDGAGGNDMIEGGAGDDTLAGAAGDDGIEGGYGDDVLSGGPGNDTLDGGRGSDLVIGGAGDDLMISGADTGEDRAGQLVLGAPSRPFPDPSIDAALLKLVDWTDQPLYADDIFLGGPGSDHMYVNTLINGKKDIILEHIVDGTRSIDWHGVAGENRYIHDHWVDGVGIDIFADFDADEDEISIIGHTTNIEVTYQAVDSDGDGTEDAILSLVRAYSQQGNGGGAHDEDMLGILAVIGDLVTEEMIETNAGAHDGIVETIDELQEALAPSDDPSPVARPGGVLGYDDRDVEGRPLSSDPIAWSVNPYMAEARPDFAWRTVSDLGPIAVVNAHPGGRLDGTGHMTMPHAPGEQQAEGSYLLSFTADSPGAGNQALLSKDFRGKQEGGHLTLWIDTNGYLKVRFQSPDDEVSLKFREKIEAGEHYDVAFSYTGEGTRLFVDGQMVDDDEGFASGMLGNDGSTAIGASTRRRVEEDDPLEWHFEGEIGKVAVLDKPVGLLEALILTGHGNDPAALGAAPFEGLPDPGEPGDPGDPVDPGDPGPVTESQYIDFALWDTGTDEKIADISPDTTISEAELSGRKVAVVGYEAVGQLVAESVEYISGHGTQVENIEPYAQFGDASGDLRGGVELGTGLHELTAKVFSGDNRGGELLETVALAFEITAAVPQPEPDPEPIPPEPLPAGRLAFGSETVRQSDPDAWHSVTFAEEIPDPVVVMGPLEHNGGHDAVVRVQNVTPQGFEFRIEEWDYLDGWHTLETVGWMAATAGAHEIAPGVTLAAGSAQSEMAHETPVEVPLAGFGSVPSVFAQVASANDVAAVTTRLKNIGTDRFSFLLQEEEAATDGTHAPERVDWIAVEGALDGLFGLDAIEGGLTHRYATQGFDPVEGTPVAIAHMQTMNGGDTASLRFRDLDGDSIRLKVTEERSLDSERNHVAEEVALLTASEGIHDLYG